MIGIITFFGLVIFAVLSALLFLSDKSGPMGADVFLSLVVLFIWGAMFTIAGVWQIVEVGLFLLGVG